MSEPDRFEANARELCASHVTYKEIAAALRAAESSALERAETLLREAEDGSADALEAEMKYRRQRDDQTANFHAGRGCVYRWLIPMLRALIPPAAAPAAEAPIRTVPMMPVDDAADDVIRAVRALRRTRKRIAREAKRRNPAP